MSDTTNKEVWRVVEVDPNDLKIDGNPDMDNAIKMHNILTPATNSYKEKLQLPVGAWRPITLNDIKDMFLRQWRIFFVENEEKKVVAMATVKKLADKDTFSLSNVVVDEAYRGRGLGKMVCEAAIEWCQPNYVTLEVSEANPHAYELYKALGFRETYKVMHLDQIKK